MAEDGRPDGAVASAASFLLRVDLPGRPADFVAALGLVRALPPLGELPHHDAARVATAAARPSSASQGISVHVSDARRAFLFTT